MPFAIAPVWFPVVASLPHPPPSATIPPSIPSLRSSKSPRRRIVVPHHRRRIEIPDLAASYTSAIQYLHLCLCDQRTVLASVDRRLQRRVRIPGETIADSTTELHRELRRGDVVELSLAFDMGDVLIGGKQSSAMINHAIEVSGLVNQECKFVVQKYGSSIMDIILKELQPDNICGQLGVCAAHGARLVLVFIDS
ncbi:hypothetical protein SASPL_108275 [Salvia splendens]|uniref:Saposin B-type domain-containing protein n=1 Tax=Salvia splendens TaxID=180675 RepID=A0A8X9A6I0_SALSN|nr:hypothetical protein SASPL_108275 [Salvia splendens]